MTTVTQLRKSRQRVVEVDGFKFTIQRPTEAVLMPLIIETGTHTNKELAEYISNLQIVKMAVVGWEGVQERHIQPSRTEDPESFKHDLFCEWIEDRPSLWPPIVIAVFEMRDQFLAAREADSKN